MAINYEDLFTNEGFDYATDLSDLQDYVPEGFEDVAGVWRYGQDRPTSFEDILGTDQGFADLSEVYFGDDGRGANIFPGVGAPTDKEAFMNALKRGSQNLHDWNWDPRGADTAAQMHGDEGMFFQGGSGAGSEWGAETFNTRKFTDDYLSYMGQPGIEYVQQYPFGHWGWIPDPDNIFEQGSDYDKILSRYMTQKYMFDLGDTFEDPFGDIIVDPQAWQENASGRRSTLNTLISGYEGARQDVRDEASDFGSALRRSRTDFATKGFAGSGPYEQNVGVGMEDYAARMDPFRDASSTAYGEIGRGMQDWHEEDYGTSGELISFYDEAELDYEDWLTQLESIS